MLEELEGVPGSISIGGPVKRDDTGSQGTPSRVRFESSQESGSYIKESGNGMMGTAATVFMARSRMEAIRKNYLMPQTKEHDLESFCWTFIYVVYVHALQDTEALSRLTAVKEDFRRRLQQEFRNLFSTTDVSKLIDRRTVALNKSAALQRDIREGITCLCRYARQYGECTPDGTQDGNDLYGIITVLWGYLKAYTSPAALRPAEWADEGTRDYEDLAQELFPVPVWKQVTHNDMIGLFKMALGKLQQRQRVPQETLRATNEVENLEYPLPRP